MPQLYANNAYGLLASSASAIATTLTLTSGNGARFPNPTGGDFFLLTLIGLDGNGNEASWEIVKCTARSTDTLTVVRAQESTTAGIWAGGTRVELRATAGGFGTYLVGNQSISVTGDASGSGTTAISLTLANSGASAGTYRSVTVNAKGLVTGGTNPTTLAGYGITDAQALDADLTAIAALAGTSGFLKKTAADTWALDTSTYITGNQTVTLSGDASGSGATAITVTLATVAATKGGTGQTTYAIGDLLYASTTSALSKLTGNTTTTKQFLTQTGTGAASNAPSWEAIANADVPSALTGKTYNALSLTAAATGFTIAGGTISKTLTMSNTLTFSGSDGSTLNIGTGGTLGTAAYATIASYAPLASPALTGTPTTTTAAVDTNTTQIASTAFVLSQAASSSPLMNGTAAVGTSLRYARTDHVHASDTSRAPLDSPTLTGTPAAPTAAVDTNTTQLATTAYVVGQGYLKSATASSTYQTQAGMSSYLTTASASTTYLPLAGGSIAGNLTFSGTGRRIIADFDNATLASRAAFQTSTTNGTTAVQAIANGTGAASYYVAFAGSDPANAAYGWISATTSGIDIYSDKTGTGSVQPIRLLTGGTVRASVGALGGVDLATGLREAKVTMGANDVDLRAGNYFTKTISGVTTLTVSNVPATGIAASFILDLTNGGSATITWWSGTKWAGGTAPTLTAAGRDVLGFFTHDGGTTWSGLVLGKDVK